MIVLSFIIYLIPAAAAEEFSDISECWARDYILEAVSKKHMTGYDDGTFRPIAAITVGEAFMVIPKLVANEYRNWFFAYKIKNGEDGKKFFTDNRLLSKDEFTNLDRPLNREELAMLLVKAARLNISDNFSGFSDSHLISADKRGYVNKMKDFGILNGTDNKFNPLSYITRAEFSAIISRMNGIKAETVIPVKIPEPAKTFLSDKQIPILLYHSITTSQEVADTNDLFVTLDKFKADLELISSLGYTPVFSKDIDKELPEKPVIITFDDGYLTNYELAYPVLQEMNMKMTIFLNGYTGDISGYEHKFTWAQAREMVDSGIIDIQTHTYHLHAFYPSGIVSIFQQYGEDTMSYISRIESDCIMQNKNFETYLGYTPSVFAYPYGLSNEATETILAKYYKSTLTTYPVVANPIGGLFSLPRITVTQSTDLDFLN